MAGYSDSEIQTSVTQFVQSDVKVTKDPLGPTDLGAKFDESLQFLSSTLVFDSNAIFYLTFLVTNKLNTDVLSLVASVQDILLALGEISRSTRAVTRTSLLGDAAASLLTLESIVTQNGAISSPAFERYKTAIDMFRDVSLAPNIKSNGTIVRPPQKAKADARISLNALESTYPVLLRNIVQLRKMLDEFMALNLPNRIVRTSVQTTRKDLLALQKTFENTKTSSDDKIAETRDAYLRITSGKSVLNNLTTISDPRGPRIASSTTLKGRAVNPLGSGVLTKASVNTTVSAPWSIQTGVNDVFNIAEDGNANTAYTLVPSPYPSLRNYIPGPYNIQADVKAVLVGFNVGPFNIPSAPDNVFTVIVDGFEFTGALTVGAAVPIATIITDIQSIAFFTSVVNVTDNGLGAVKLEYVNPGVFSIIIGQADPLYTSVNTALGFFVGESNTGTEAHNLIEIDGLAPTITLTTGAARTAAQIVTDINTWVTANYPGIYSAAVEVVGPVSYVRVTKNQAGEQLLEMTAPSSGPSRNTVLRAYQTLGFNEGQADSAAYMTAAEVAAVVNGVGLVTATPVRVSRNEGLSGACVSGTGFTVANIDFIVPGDFLVIRHGDNSGYYRIVSVFALLLMIDAAKPFPVTGTSNESWLVQHESLSVVSKNGTVATKLVVSAGTANATVGLNAGTYLGMTTGFRAATSGVDTTFTSKDVAVGDVLQIPSQADRKVLQISADGKQLEVSPALIANASILLDFQILSVDAIEYEQLAADLNEWDAKRTTSKYAKDVRELTRVLNPILNRDSSSTATSIGDAHNTATELLELLDFVPLTLPNTLGLTQYLVEFEVRTIPRMDAGLRMLLERGFDRAYESLVRGRVAEFFGFDKDDAGTGSYLLKSMRIVAQKDVNVSRSDEDAADTQYLHTSIEPDANYNFSDQDKDDNLVLLGERTVIDADDPSGNNTSVSRSRY